jgi:hypothetical protein
VHVSDREGPGPGSESGAPTLVVTEPGAAEQRGGSL